MIKILGNNLRDKVKHKKEKICAQQLVDLNNGDLSGYNLYLPGNSSSPLNFNPRLVSENKNNQPGENIYEAE